MFVKKQILEPNSICIISPNILFMIILLLPPQKKNPSQLSRQRNAYSITRSILKYIVWPKNIRRDISFESRVSSFHLPHIYNKLSVDSLFSYIFHAPSTTLHPAKDYVIYARFA